MLNNSNEMFLVTYLQSMVILISKHRIESYILKKRKKKEKERKTMKKSNVDLN